MCMCAVFSGKRCCLIMSYYIMIYLLSKYNHDISALETTQPLLLYLRLNAFCFRFRSITISQGPNLGINGSPRSGSAGGAPQMNSSFFGSTHLQPKLEFDSSHTLRFRTRTIKKPMGAEKQLFREYKPKYPHNTPRPNIQGTIPPFSGSMSVS